MVVCQFFLENRCKFGENCRNEHSHGGAQRSLFGGASQAWQQTGGSHRVTFRDTFGSSGQASNSQYKWTANQQTGQGSDSSSCQQTSTVDLVNSLPKEMDSWEKSHMWPFSCFSVDKDLASLPEFYDICPEELRFEAYQAMKSANLQSYDQRVLSLKSEFENRRRQLQHMTMDLKSKLMAVIDEARKKKLTQSASANTTVFGFTQPTQQTIGQSLTSDLFGKSTGASGSSSSGFFGKSSGTSGSSSSGLFGKSPGTSGGSSSGLFGKSASGSSFGGLLSSENSGLFGSSGSSLFGKPSGAGSVFGNQPQAQNFQTQNQFGILNQNNTTDLFDQSTSMAQQTNNLFGNAANQSTNQSLNIFGSPLVSQSQSLFGQPAANLGQASNTSFSHGSSAPAATQVSLFGASKSHSNPTATLFGKPLADSISTAQNIFGHQPPGQVQPCRDTAEQNQSSVFGGSSAVSSVGQGHYTPLEDLSELEKEAFSAKAFELGRIPIHPPPRQMVN